MWAFSDSVNESVMPMLWSPSKNFGPQNWKLGRPPGSVVLHVCHLMCPENSAPWLYGGETMEAPCLVFLLCCRLMSVCPQIHMRKPYSPR